MIINIPDLINNVQGVSSIVPIIMTLCLSGGSESTRNRVHLDGRRVSVLVTRQRESGPEEKLEAAVRRNGGRKPRQISQDGHYGGNEGRFNTQKSSNSPSCCFIRWNCLQLSRFIFVY